MKLSKTVAIYTCYVEIKSSTNTPNPKNRWTQRDKEGRSSMDTSRMEYSRFTLEIKNLTVPRSYKEAEHNQGYVIDRSTYNTPKL